MCQFDAGKVYSEEEPQCYVSTTAAVLYRLAFDWMANGRQHDSLPALASQTGALLYKLESLPDHSVELKAFLEQAADMGYHNQEFTVALDVPIWIECVKESSLLVATCANKPQITEASKRAKAVKRTELKQTVAKDCTKAGEASEPNEATAGDLGML